MSNAGRRSKYSKETAENIVEIIKAGNYINVACGAVGIHPDTFFEWMKKHPEFSDAVKKAKYEAEARNVAIIAKSATRTWQAAAWYLERKHNDRWGKKEKNEVTMSGDPQLIVQLPKVEKPTDAPGN